MENVYHTARLNTRNAWQAFTVLQGQSKMIQEVQVYWEQAFFCVSYFRRDHWKRFQFCTRLFLSTRMSSCQPNTGTKLSILPCCTGHFLCSQLYIRYRNTAIIIKQRLQRDLKAVMGPRNCDFTVVGLLVTRVHRGRQVVGHKVPLGHPGLTLTLNDVSV